MATVQVNLDVDKWDKLAKFLGVSGPDEAVNKAYDIAAYVAQVQEDPKQKLMLNKGGQYFDLNLTNSKSNTP